MVITEAHYMHQRLHGVILPENITQKIITGLVSVAGVIISIISIPTIKGLSLFEWQLFPVIGLIVLNYGIFGRVLILFACFFILSLKKKKNVLLQKNQKETIILTIFGIIGLVVMNGVLKTNYWTSYNEFDEKNSLLVIFICASFLFNYVITYIRDTALMLLFVNGRIDIVGMLDRKIEKLLWIKYKYRVDKKKGYLLIKTVLKRISDQIAKKKEEIKKQQENDKIYQFSKVILGQSGLKNL
jgi:hypothetical protein